MKQIFSFVNHGNSFGLVIFDLLQRVSQLFRIQAFFSRYLWMTIFVNCILIRFTSMQLRKLLNDVIFIDVMPMPFLVHYSLHVVILPLDLCITGSENIAKILCCGWLLINTQLLKDFIILNSLCFLLLFSRGFISSIRFKGIL